MAMAVVVGLIAVVIALLAALWPPPSAPHWWRHGTRPLRRWLRPKHYGHFR